MSRRPSSKAAWSWSAVVAALYLPAAFVIGTFTQLGYLGIFGLGSMAFQIPTFRLLVMSGPTFVTLAFAVAVVQLLPVVPKRFPLVSLLGAMIVNVGMLPLLMRAGPETSPMKLLACVGLLHLLAVVTTCGAMAELLSNRAAVSQRAVAVFLALTLIMETAALVGMEKALWQIENGFKSDLHAVLHGGGESLPVLFANSERAYLLERFSTDEVIVRPRRWDEIAGLTVKR